MKRKSEAVEVDATAEKIAKLKETAAEVVAEVSPQFPFFCFGITLENTRCKNCNFVRNLQFFGCPDCFVFLRQLGVKNINSTVKEASMKSVLGLLSILENTFSSLYFPLLS